MPEGANPDRRLVRYRESSYALNRAIQDQPAHTRGRKLGPCEQKLIWNILEIEIRKHKANGGGQGGLLRTRIPSIKYP